ncbi:MAG: indole-3-glycerol phosphate synthase TrpC [Alphaproteobacteria bacterium]|nr:indole-3-glycerol phosphate synthase TrpC [Alphaproteobacteria bacterium]
MTNVLTKICDDKRAQVAVRRRQLSQAALERRANDQGRPRGFHAALQRTRAEGRYGLIAEIKKASPSKGLIRADFDPPALARAYALGGASCLSVLTDVPYFQGDDSYLVAARAAVDLPVLRKDFIIDPYQVPESRALGADCILVIMAAVEDSLAAELEAAALALQMDVLIEIHDDEELERALKLRSRLLGINNRDLTTLKVDLATTERLAAKVPLGYALVSESGLGGPADLARMAAAGASCFLIGEALMREPDVAVATARLLMRADAPQRAIG